MELIARKNAGLPLNPDEISHKEEQALLVTHAALEKWKSDEIKKGRKDVKGRQGKDEHQNGNLD